MGASDWISWSCMLHPTNLTSKRPRPQPEIRSELGAPRVSINSITFAIKRSLFIILGKDRPMGHTFFGATMTMSSMLLSLVGDPYAMR